jgi:hypothetical protein
MKTYSRNGGTTPHIINLSTGTDWSAPCKGRYSRGKQSLVSSEKGTRENKLNNSECKNKEIGKKDIANKQSIIIYVRASRAYR